MSTTVAATILATMLALQPAGRSFYSVVEVAEDEERACLDESPLCAPSRWHRLRRAWVRYETEGEGILRYETIARALGLIAAEVDDGVEGAPSWPKGRGDELLRYLLTVAHHESGFRRDVHEGATLGDQGKSWCLIQRNLGVSGRALTSRGWRARELVGLDLEATYRCLVTGADVLGYARQVCQGRAYCIFAVYGGVRSAYDGRVFERVKTLKALACSQKTGSI